MQPTSAHKKTGSDWRRERGGKTPDPLYCKFYKPLKMMSSTSCQKKTAVFARKDDGGGLWRRKGGETPAPADIYLTKSKKLVNPFGWEEKIIIRPYV